MDLFLSTDLLIKNIQDTRSRLLQLVMDLDEDQIYGPLLDTVNPPIWEIGHVAWFQEKWISRNLDIKPSVRNGVDLLYNSFDVRHDWRWDLDLPSVKETLRYLEEVLDVSINRIRGNEISSREAYFYLLAIFHEDMHGEAITYTRQALGYPAPSFLGVEGSHSKSEENLPFLIRDVEIPSGTFYLGAVPDSSFVFDNEKWVHPVGIEKFSIANTTVTNQQFQNFVDDAGYQNQRFWSPEGWEWRNRTNAKWPVYWEPDSNGNWLYRRFDQWFPLQPYHPIIHVNWFEANAYCKWATRRLPTESEWEVAASSDDRILVNGLPNSKSLFPWGNAPFSKERANLNSLGLGTKDVRDFPSSDSVFGCRQMIGNIWEWTADAFWPFPGFVLDPYREYSAPWFGDHKILRGGSWATQSRLIRNTWRNFYQPHRRDIFAGFRTCAP
jgi:iron(II)-dependent oxidoreductase